MNRKTIGIIISALILLVLIILIGPMNIFTHGYYCDVVDYDQIAVEDWGEYIHLGEGDYEMQFSPQSNNLVGFEIILVNQPDNNSGILQMDIYNSSGKKIDKISIDLSQFSATEWYRVYFNKSLKKGNVYTLKFSAEDCATVPYLITVNSDYLSEESMSGNVLLGYAYSESTFSLQNKVLIVMLLVSIWGVVVASLSDKIMWKYVEKIAVFFLLTGILAWNYMYNSMDNQNIKFEEFKETSDSLVLSELGAEHNGAVLNEYGLGFYTDESGSWYPLGESNSFISDENWRKGYSKTEPSICISNNAYTNELACAGNYVQFSNGAQILIESVTVNDQYLIINLDSSQLLNTYKYGELKDIKFLYSNGEVALKGDLRPYTSQYGLQGKVFRNLAKYMDYEEAVDNLRLFCCIINATVFVSFSFLIKKKYNVILAGCFLVTFWLSPWIVNFAVSLYWVEFTLFIPMLIGLLCSWKLHSKKIRVICYIAAFASIMIKCLCGYEYISAIMMGLVSFLGVDLVLSIVQRNRKDTLLHVRTILILGVVALAGFMAAICIHASLRGSGDIVEGIKTIIEQDVLRRTNGADLNNYKDSKVMIDSLNASVWETLCKYFHFSTEIIAGIQGNLFPALCILPICIFVYEYKKQKLNVELLGMYIMFFLTAISWFCLAKAHSYIHGGLNFVLWYFGFVQVCLYIIINKVIEGLKMSKLRKKEDE